MLNPAYILRSMQLNDLAGAMKLSTAAGWNQTERDWRLLVENPQNICLVAENDGKIIGTTAAINYSNQVAWIGMVLVDKESRGNGVSKLLLTDIIKKLEHVTSLKLDATPEGQPVYKKFDFKDEYFITRMLNTSMEIVANDNENSVPIQLTDLPEIIALDESIFGVNRSLLIQFLFSEYPGKGWLLKRNDRIAGFAFGRDGYKYHHIGPVAASTSGDAIILITKALNQLTHQSVIVDVPFDKEELISWLNSHGFIKQRHFTRMYQKENPLPGLPGKQYLICGPEFG